MLLKVKKRTLLIIAGIVWLIAGFNVARLGVISYGIIEPKWYLYLLSVAVFFIFGMMFFKMSKKHTKSIETRKGSGLVFGWRKRWPVEEAHIEVIWQGINYIV